MADIDMQRLDWKQALRVYEQIRTIAPDDQPTRRHLVELNLRMSQIDKAMSELENYIVYLESQNKSEIAIAFLKELAQEYDEQPIIKRALAAQLHRNGQTEEALGILDVLGEALIQSGDKKNAIEVINQIITMNPPNVDEYRQLFIQMQSD
jgi:tetratricopeptide (TPR) repeat protein